VAILLLGG